MKINYFGLKLDVPEWGNYIATDVTGIVYAYRYDPKFINNFEWISPDAEDLIVHERLGRFSLTQIDEILYKDPNFYGNSKLAVIDLVEHDSGENELVKTLNSRDKTHGDFSENARLTNEFEKVAKTSINYLVLSDMQKTALYLIFQKLGRLLSGDKDYQDHWHDIAGYATLIGEELKKCD